MAGDAADRPITRPEELTLGQVYLYLLVILTGAALLSASTQNLAHLSEGRDDVPFWYPLIWELTGFYSVLLFVPLVYWAQRRWPLVRGSWLTRGPLHLGIAAVVSVLTTSTFYLLRVGIYRVLGLGEYEYGILAYRYVFELHKFVVIYAFFVGLFWLHRYVAEGRARQAESARLAQDLAEARLASLAAQVHPHFLFNALNTISSVMYDDPHRADAMISRLGDLLRSSLAHTGRPTVPIEEERRILGLYVDLMAARFGSRLRVSVACPEALSQALVPAFLLQPLVENAIKHHPMENASVAEVDVILGADAGRLVVTVEDNGRGLKSDEHGGVGLSNLRGRLRHLYGEEHDLRLENRPEGGLRVALRLPLRFADAPPGPESR